ncbi:MAG TPA: hypothetical protein VGJ20_20485 [Xanthobacteraceae bacterium]|jgi:hypothetical protein
MGNIGAMTGFGGADASLTGLMQDYNNWTYGSNVVANDQAFAHSGIPTSTGNTYANVGGEANKVYQETRESDAERAANQQVANAQKGAVSSGVGALGSLAGGLGGI